MSEQTGQIFLAPRRRLAPRRPPAAAPAGAPALAAHPGTEFRGYAGIPKTGPLAPELVAELRHGYLACVSFLAQRSPRRSA